MTATVDRARWLQLAEGWTALSKMPLTRLPAPHHDGTGMPPSELSKASTDPRRGESTGGGAESRLHLCSELGKAQPGVCLIDTIKRRFIRSSSDRIVRLSLGRIVYVA